MSDSAEIETRNMLCDYNFTTKIMADAIRNNNVEMVQELFDHNAKFEPKIISDVVAIIIKNSGYLMPITKVLFENSIKLEPKITTELLIRAIKIGDSQMAQILFNNGAILDPKISSELLTKAIMMNDVLMTKFLFDNGARLESNTAHMLGNKYAIFE